MSLWKLTAHRVNGFEIELGLYDFDPVDHYVKSDEVVLRNHETYDSTMIGSIHFKRIGDVKHKT